MNKVFKSAVCVVLCLVMCTSLCACDVLYDAIDSISSLIIPKGIVEDVSLGYTQIEKVDFTYSEHYKPYECRDSYELLESDDMRKLYDMLLVNAYFVYPQADENSEYKTKQVILEDVILTEAKIRLVIKALIDDNPQMFWLTSTFGFLVDEDRNYTAAQLYSRYSPTELISCEKKLREKVNSFFAPLDKGKTPYQLELFIHDYIVDNCEYDESVKQKDDSELLESAVFDVYGALVDGVAVCEGYSRSFQLLCNGVGIRSFNIVGKSEDDLHMWSAVVLDGDWYYVDVTWDDCSGEALRYDYFNINEKQLEKDHEFSKLTREMTDKEITGSESGKALTSNFFIPDCTQSAFNYYVRQSPHLTDYDSDEVVESLLKTATKKQEYFHIYISPDDFDYDEAVDMLFYTYPQYFFSYVDEVNYSLPDYSIDNSNISIYKKKTLSVVTVELKYV